MRVEVFLTADEIDQLSEFWKTKPDLVKDLSESDYQLLTNSLRHMMGSIWSEEELVKHRSTSTISVVEGAELLD